MKVSARAWSPAGPSPIPDHGRLGKKGEKDYNKNIT